MRLAGKLWDDPAYADDMEEAVALTQGWLLELTTRELAERGILDEDRDYGPSKRRRKKKPQVRILAVAA
jgi:hypothetical protein